MGLKDRNGQSPITRRRMLVLETPTKEQKFFLFPSNFIRLITSFAFSLSLFVLRSFYYFFLLKCCYYSVSSCVDNCDEKLNPSRRLALITLCGGSSCGRGLSYLWSLFKSSNNSSSRPDWIQIKNLKDITRTRLISPRIVTYPGVLDPGTLYKFVLAVKRRGGIPGYSEYQVTTNSPPSGGKCTVNPQSGITLVTEFTIACANWQDDDLPLQYEFSYVRNGDLLNVVYKGFKDNKVTKLPAGEKANNFTIDFRVRVADSFGAFTEVRTPVQVRGKTTIIVIALKRNSSL